MDSMLNLNEIEMDALREVGNVGVGNAATALSKMINRKIDINIPSTEFIPIQKFSEKMGGAETVVTAIYLNISGDLGGETIFLFKDEEARRLVDLMMMQEVGTTKEMGEMEISAFKEMSNIFTGSYLNSLANMIGLKIFPGVPNVATDMLQALVDRVLITVGNYANKILCVSTKISMENVNITGDFVLMFDDQSLKKILEELHKKYGIQ